MLKGPFQIHKNAEPYKMFWYHFYSAYLKLHVLKPEISIVGEIVKPTLASIFLAQIKIQHQRLFYNIFLSQQRQMHNKKYQRDYKIFHRSFFCKMI